MGSSASSITPSASPESQEGTVVVVPTHVQCRLDAASPAAFSGVSAQDWKSPRSRPHNKDGTRQILTGFGKWI
ncbi:hypothetical protein BsWGS_05884 [Bradybaena similaris]